MWKIRPNFSHLYSPIRPHVRCLTDYIKREKFNDILHRCGFLTPIFADNATCNLLDRLYQTWEIQYYTAHMWQNSIEVIQDVTYWTEYIICENSNRISHTYICENIKCKISDLIGQTWGIRPNTSQMWTVWPKSTKLSHIQQNTSHVKNPTEFLTPIFADNVSCKIFDRLCQTWKIQWYTTRLWKNRPNSYKLWLIGQKTSHVKNATEFLTPLFTESVSPVWHLTKYSTRE